MSTSAERRSRRELLRGVARGGLLALLGAGAFWLAWRNRPDEDCRLRIACDSCRLKGGCDLPRRQAARERERRESS